MGSTATLKATQAPKELRQGRDSVRGQATAYLGVDLSTRPPNAQMLGLERQGLTAALGLHMRDLLWAAQLLSGKGGIQIQTHLSAELSAFTVWPAR